MNHSLANDSRVEGSPVSLTHQQRHGEFNLALIGENGCRVVLVRDPISSQSPLDPSLANDPAESKACPERPNRARESNKDHLFLSAVSGNSPMRWLGLQLWPICPPLPEVNESPLCSRNKLIELFCIRAGLQPCRLGSDTTNAPRGATATGSGKSAMNRGRAAIYFPDCLRRLRIHALTPQSS